MSLETGYKPTDEVTPEEERILLYFASLHLLSYLSPDSPIRSYHEERVHVYEKEMAEKIPLQTTIFQTASVER